MTRSSRICIIGATGYVGRCFTQLAKSRGLTIGSVGRSGCDLYSVEELTRKLDQLSPDFVVNCAGYTGKPNVDACELDKANCLAGNAVLPGVISESCRRLGVRWGHVSSGCIYTGRRPDGGGFDENDPPNFSFRTDNCSFYSGTKALGEELLIDDDNCYVWRLRIPFDEFDSPRNYLSKLCNYETLLEAENSLSHLGEFVSACIDCLVNEIPSGIYNLTNPGSVKTSEVVDLLKSGGVLKRDVKFFSSESEFMSIAAKTPRSNCVLDSSKAIQSGLRLSPVREALMEAIANWQSRS